MKLAASCGSLAHIFFMTIMHDTSLQIAVQMCMCILSHVYIRALLDIFVRFLYKSLQADHHE